MQFRKDAVSPVALFAQGAGGGPLLARGSILMVMRYLLVSHCKCSSFSPLDDGLFERLVH